jgi:hypothetical protein
VTSVSGQDAARVAKWGFTGTDANVVFTDLFVDTYGTTVKGTAGANVIAPGTSGKGTFQFLYAAAGIDAPEVAYTFTVSTYGSSIADDIKSNTNIQWKLDDGAWGTWDAMIAAIEALSGDPSGTKEYAPNKLPDAFGTANPTHTVEWQWVFANTPEVDAEDITDTALGNKGTLDPVTLKITITATQKD